MSRLDERFDNIEELIYDLRERVSELESLDTSATETNSLRERIKELEFDVKFWQNKCDELVIKYERKYD